MHPAACDTPGFSVPGSDVGTLHFLETQHATGSTETLLRPMTAMRAVLFRIFSINDGLAMSSSRRVAERVPENVVKIPQRRGGGTVEDSMWHVARGEEVRGP